MKCKKCDANLVEGVEVCECGEKIADTLNAEAKLKVAGFDFTFHAKIADITVKADGDEEKRYIEGYASTEDLDRGNEITHKEAFAKSLKKFMKDNPLLTFMHNWSEPIGKVVESRIDGKGLWVKAEIVQDDPVADRVWNLITQKVLRAFSFGYRVNKFEDEPQKDGKIIRHLKDVELLEVAVVSIGMNRNTFFSVAKALELGSDSVLKVPEEKVDDNETTEIVETVKELIDEVKAGRVLSKKNRTAVASALTALQEVLDADQPPTPDDSDDGKSGKGKEEKVEEEKVEEEKIEEEKEIKVVKEEIIEFDFTSLYDTINSCAVIIGHELSVQQELSKLTATVVSD